MGNNHFPTTGLILLPRSADLTGSEVEEMTHLPTSTNINYPGLNNIIGRMISVSVSDLHIAQTITVNWRPYSSPIPQCPPCQISIPFTEPFNCPAELWIRKRFQIGHEIEKILL